MKGMKDYKFHKRKQNDKYFGWGRFSQNSLQHVLLLLSYDLNILIKNDFLPEQKEVGDKQDFGSLQTSRLQSGQWKLKASKNKPALWWVQF